MTIQGARSRALSLGLIALVLCGLPTFAGNKIAAIGGCYHGTYSGWRVGTVREFHFEVPEGPSLDPTILIPFLGRGFENDQLIDAIWQGSTVNQSQPGGFLIVRNHLYGNGTYFSGSLNQPENVLLTGKATMDGETVKLNFVTQRRETLKFNVTRSSTEIQIDQTNPTVQSSPDPNNEATIDLTATILGLDDTAVQWSFVNSNGATFPNEEAIPADNKVTVAVPTTYDGFTVTVKATPYMDACVSTTVDITVLPAPSE